MCIECKRTARNYDSSGSDLPRLLAMKWFLLDQPWADSDVAGTLILSGSPDPHVGKAIADTMGMDDELELHEQQLIASYIVELHNSRKELIQIILNTKPQN